MIGSSPLGRKIALYMCIVSAITLAIGTAGSYVIYAWLYARDPGYFDGSPWSIRLFDAGVVLLFLLVAGSISVAIALQLARQIIRPLTSIAKAAGTIKGGDLSARAVVGDRSLGEAADLVEDFNAMAARLEGLANDMTTWNASIAHELRTPVTILLGRLKGVNDGLFELDPALLLSLIKQTETLARLIEDLRVVSLADSGHLHLNFAPTDLAETVGDLRRAVEPGLIEAGFRTDWRLPTVQADCDAFRIRQAVLALLENARKHATPGILRVEVGQRLGFGLITVSDGGPGLTPTTTRMIFDPFVRGDAVKEGTGLGLAVVQAIAHGHYGQVTCRANAEGGSCFELSLPLRQA